jgi:hypothetical protein
VQASGFDYRAWRGNVFSYASSPLNAHAAFNIDWGNGDGSGMQPHRGHRMAIMAIDGDYTNVGLAAVAEGKPSTAVGPWVITGNYANAQVNGTDQFNRFLVGTVWQDGNGNGRYEPGEGRGGVQVMPDRGDWFALTSAGGGYAIPVTAGAYMVRFSGGGVSGAIEKRAEVGEQSMRIDWLVGELPAAVYELTTGLLTLRGVDIHDAQGKVSRFDGELQLVAGKSPLALSLKRAESARYPSTGAGPRFRPETNALELPLVEVRDAGGLVGRYAVELERVPNTSPVQLRLRKAEPVG